MARPYTQFELGVIASLAWQIKGLREGHVPEDATRRILRASLRRINPISRGRSVRVNADTSTHIDHIIPVSVVATLLLKSSNVSIGGVTRILDRYLRSAVITVEEHRVVLRDYHSTMPPGWDPDCEDADNDLVRYDKVGIVLVEDPALSGKNVRERSNEPNSRQRFPLRYFYEFASLNELDADVVRIEELARAVPEAQQERKSTFRRGLAIELLEQENLLDSFLSEFWPYGLTAAGRGEMNQCKNFAKRHSHPRPVQRG